MPVFGSVTAELSKVAIFEIFDMNPNNWMQNLLQEHDLQLAVTAVDKENTIDIKGDFRVIHKIFKIVLTLTYQHDSGCPSTIKRTVDKSDDTFVNSSNGTTVGKLSTTKLPIETTHDETVTDLKLQHCSENVNGFIVDLQSSSSKTHKCTQCLKHFTTHKLLKSHALTHKKDKDLRCEECGKQYKYEKSLVEHVKKHAKDDYKSSIIGGYCSAAFDDQSKLQQHTDSNQNRKNLLDSERDPKEIYIKREVEDHEYDTDNLRNDNMKNEEQDSVLNSNNIIALGKTNNNLDCTTVKSLKVKKESNLACTYCPYIGKTKGGLKSHERYNHKKKFSCSVCAKAFGSKKDVRRHLNKHTLPTHKCNICGKMYKELNSMLEHTKKHDKSYVAPTVRCEYCSKSFCNKSYLKKHTAYQHLGVKMNMFLCQTCGKQFSQKHHYHNHLNSHLDIKPYVCEICGMAFSQTKYLAMHKYKHSETRDFECPTCHKRFRQPEVLKAHRRIHNGRKDHACSFCQRRFNTRCSLSRHVRIHLGTKPFKCAVCNQSFRDASILRRHLLLVHKCDRKTWSEGVIKIPRDQLMSQLDGVRDSNAQDPQCVSVV